MRNEKWRVIPRYEHYEASDRGRVRSVDRTITVNSVLKGTYTKKIRGRVLKPRINRRGHLGLALGRGDKNFFDVHALIARTFHGRRPLNADVTHKNGRPTDNRACNLEYKSRGENNKDVFWHGRRKVTLAQVQKIRKTRSAKERLRLAKEFDISYSHVRKIRSMERYAHA